MVWRPRDNQEIGGTNTARHCVVDIRVVMRSKVVPNENPMKISAGDIVCLNIPAEVVAEVTKYILVVVPVARTQWIQCRGRSTLPRTCGARRGSPGLIAKMTVIFAPWW